MTLIAGATCHPPTYTAAAYSTDNALIGPLKIGRYFNPAGSAFPASWSECAGSQDAPWYITPFQSVKVPNNDYAGFIAGDYDAPFQALMATIPLGTWFTVNHEPENDMPGATFTALFRHAYTLAKPANSGLVMGPVHQAYPYGTVAGQTAQPADYDVGDAYRDFTGLDLYGVVNVAAHPARYVTLENDTFWGFQQWFKHYDGSARPLAMVERGLMPGTTATPSRSSVLQDDIAFCQANNFCTYIYWNGSGSSGDWSLNAVPADCAAYASIAAGVNG